MIKDYFGEWTDGRLGRGRFALLYLVAVAIGFAMVFLLMNGVFAPTEGATGPRNLINNLPPLSQGLLSILMIGLQIAVLNIISKRGRDAGLSGLLTVLVFIVVVAAGFFFMREQTAIVALVFVIILALIPTGQFGARTEIAPDHDAPEHEEA